MNECKKGVDNYKNREKNKQTGEDENSFLEQKEKCTTFVKEGE